jgi:hypothetical protein
MATHEIPEKDWATYFQAFTERHRGARVTIENVDPLTQPEIATRDLPFVGIAYHHTASGAAAIELTFGNETGHGSSTHTVHAPKEVFHKPGAGVLSSEVNPDEVLEITTSERPPVHLITFRHSS